jgi:hypothetical protein
MLPPGHGLGWRNTPEKSGTPTKELDQWDAHFSMHGVQAQNYHIMTPAVGKDWALAWGCNSYVKELPYANAAYNYNFKPGEAGKLTLEFWITPFDYAGCEGPQRAVESVLTENKLIGLSWAVVSPHLERALIGLAAGSTMAARGFLGAGIFSSPIAASAAPRASAALP